MAKLKYVTFSDGEYLALILPSTYRVLTWCRIGQDDDLEEIWSDILGCSRSSPPMSKEWLWQY